MPYSENIIQLIQEDNGYLEIKKLGLPVEHENRSQIQGSVRHELLFLDFFPMQVSSSISNTLYPNGAHLGKIQLPGTNKLM